MKMKHGWIGLLMLVLSACATDGQQSTREVNPDDPWQGYNRPVFNFNEKLDQYFLKPVAKGYQAVTPEVVDRSITNVFDNIATVGTIANDLLQLKGRQAASDTGRLLFNSTFGVLGIFDVASDMGLEKHDEDFGQTLGYWGVESGPYFVLPFLGPSTVRDAASLVPDNAIDPVANWSEVRERNSAQGLRVVDKRASLLEAEKVISGDRYTFIRDAYLQNREYLIKDGEVEDGFDDNY